MLHNNLESLTFDIDMDAKNWLKALDYVKFLMAASRMGVKKVVVRIHRECDLFRDTSTILNEIVKVIEINHSVEVSDLEDR